MKISGTNAEKILSGKNAILVKNVEWQDVNKLHKHFSKLGLKTAIRLQPSDKCFMDGLKKYPQSTTIDSNSEEGDRGWFRFNLQQLKPMIFCAKVETDILGDNDAAVYSITNHRYRWNPVVLFIFGIYLSLKIELYLLNTLPKFIDTNIIVTVISLIILFASILYLPKIFQPPQIMTFRNYKNGNTIIIEECFSWSLRIKKYHVRNKAGKIVGHIFRTRDTAYYEDLNLVRQFKYDSSISLSDSADDLIHKISDEFINNSLLESVINIYHRISKRVSRHKSSKSNTSRYNKHAKPIFNYDKQSVAAITALPIPGTRINFEFVDENRSLILIAFSWLALNKFLL